ncbi:MAG: hypothetical protein WC237_02005 [Candidatus Paceibacterota bacterium]
MHLWTYIKSRNETLLVVVIAVVVVISLIIWFFQDKAPIQEISEQSITNQKEITQNDNFQNSMFIRIRDKLTFNNEPYHGLEDGSYLPVLRLPIKYFHKDDFRGGIWNTAEIKDSDYTNATLTGNDAYQSFPTTTITFHSWSSDAEPILPIKTKSQIREIINTYPELYEDNLKQYGEFTTRFWPNRYVTEKQYFDVDNDGKDESIISLCSNMGGNMDCPDKINIIKGNQIIFTASGEGIGISSSKTDDGFYIEWTDRDTPPNLFMGYCCSAGNKKTRFIFYNNEFKPLYEQEIRYFEVIDTQF